MYVAPSAPSSIGGVIDDAIRLFRSSFSRVWILALSLSATLIGYQLIVAVLVPGWRRAARTGVHSGSWFLGSVLALVAFYLALLAVTGLLEGGLIARQAAIATGNVSFSLGQAFTAGMRRVPRLLAAMLLCGLAVAGSAIIGIIIIAEANMWAIGLELHRSGRVLLQAVGFAVAVIPAIYVIVRLQLWMVGIFADGCTARGSLNESWRLTRGHWWRAVALLSMVFILAMVFTFSLTFAAGILGAAAHLRPKTLGLLVVISMLAVRIFLFPLMTALWLAMYRDFKLRRQGDDLLARVGALST